MQCTCAHAILTHQGIKPAVANGLVEIRVASAAGWLRQAVETKPAAGAVRHGLSGLPRIASASVVYEMSDDFVLACRL